jgi:hypothetical protein
MRRVVQDAGVGTLKSPALVRPCWFIFPRYSHAHRPLSILTCALEAVVMSFPYEILLDLNSEQRFCCETNELLPLGLRKPVDSPLYLQDNFVEPRLHAPT